VFAKQLREMEIATTKTLHTKGSNKFVEMFHKSSTIMAIVMWGRTYARRRRARYVRRAGEHARSAHRTFRQAVAN